MMSTCFGFEELKFSDLGKLRKHRELLHHSVSQLGKRSDTNP